MAHGAEIVYAYETLETHGRCVSVATAAHVAGLAHYVSGLKDPYAQNRAVRLRTMMPLHQTNTDAAVRFAAAAHAAGSSPLHTFT